MSPDDNEREDVHHEKESSPLGPMGMNITIYLEEDGQVVITDLPEELLDLVKKLDPCAEISCAITPLQAK